MRKNWGELQEAYAWVVDADLKDFVGSVDHDKLLELVNQQVSDGRVLGLLRQMLKSGMVAGGSRLPTEQGTPQGGVVSPLLSNVLLTPFDREMRRRGHRLTRYADDWLLTCRSRGEARAALETAKRILAKLGVTLNAGKTRIVHVRQGFEFAGYKINQGQRPLRLPSSKITSGAPCGSALRDSAGQVHTQLQGSDPGTYPPQGSGHDSGTDRPDQSGHSRVGPVLSQGPRAQALPPA